MTFLGAYLVFVFLGSLFALANMGVILEGVSRGMNGSNALIMLGELPADQQAPVRNLLKNLTLFFVCMWFVHAWPVYVLRALLSSIRQ